MKIRMLVGQEGPTLSRVRGQILEVGVDVLEDEAGRLIGADFAEEVAERRVVPQVPPAEAPQADQPPVDTPPADAPPVDQAPVDTPPADAPPVDQAPVDTPPADAPPVDQPPADQPPADQPPAATPPADAPVVTAPKKSKRKPAAQA